MSTLVFDSGACMAKVGFSKPRVCLNAVVKAKSVRQRVFIGDELEKDCKDLSGLYYLLPCQKGYIVNWDVQRQVWDYLFGKDGLKVTCSDTTLVVTEPYFNFPSIREGMHEMFFEEFGFRGLHRCTPADLVNREHGREQERAGRGKPQCCVVIDSGYSFTHIIPYCLGKPLPQHIRRINIGGKMLTNHLKDIISYRQLMVMDETYVMNQVKEDVCYVTQDFGADVEVARQRGEANTIAREYVLPDYSHIKRGYVRQAGKRDKAASADEQVIRMNIERFSVPEILFSPSDVGIQEMGVAEALVHVVERCPLEARPHLYDNIVLTGGNACLRGFKERLLKEVRALAPSEYDVEVTLPDNPSTYAWQGGLNFSKTPDFKNHVVTKAQYEEHGHNLCTDVFKDF